jgi:hypothetical protein
VYTSLRDCQRPQANMPRPRPGPAGNQAFPFSADADISYLRSIKLFSLQDLRDNVNKLQSVCTILYTSTSAGHVRYLEQMDALDVINDVSQVQTES